MITKLNKDKIIDWLMNNEVVLQDIVGRVDERSLPEVDLFDEEYRNQRFQEIKNGIKDEVSRDLGIHGSSFDDSINDVDLDDFLEQLQECDHYDIDEGYCLQCGEDLREDMMARAYDFTKGQRQDRDC